MAEVKRQPVWREFSVSSSADVLIVRRAVHELAARLEFPEKRCAEIMLAASELAQNHVSFNTECGKIMVSGLFLGTCSLITLFSADKGPGIKDLPLALSDGFTSGKSYGNGLGTVSRLADDFAICSGIQGPMPCSEAVAQGARRGTVVAASFFSKNGKKMGPAQQLTVSALVCPKEREIFCGDGIFMKCAENTTLFVLADVLGHGRDASESISMFWELLDILDPLSHLEETICALDRGFGARRGFAGLFMKVDTAASVITACGVGNIRAIMHDGTRRISITSLPGVIGQNINCRRLMVQEFSMQDEMACIVFSDGVDGSRFDANFTNDLPPLFHTYLAFETALAREDDASVVAWKWQRR